MNYLNWNRQNIQFRTSFNSSNYGCRPNLAFTTSLITRQNKVGRETNLNCINYLNWYRQNKQFRTSFNSSEYYTSFSSRLDVDASTPFDRLMILAVLEVFIFLTF